MAYRGVKVLESHTDYIARYSEELNKPRETQEQRNLKIQNNAFFEQLIT
jgi:hypothetical protein